MISDGLATSPDWLNVSRETLANLRRFEGLVLKWNPAINLVAKSTVEQIWSRHVLDSAQLFAFCPNGARNWVDLGSGGGFPGLVIAIIAQESAPELRLTLVESDQRKATFLRQVVRELNLNAAVMTTRIEDLPASNADVLSARALAPLARLCEFAALHLGKDGVALFQKGERYEAELADAHQSWAFDLQIHPSRTESAAVTLEMRSIAHV